MERCTALSVSIEENTQCIKVLEGFVIKSGFLVKFFVSFQFGLRACYLANELQDDTIFK